jgi:hypothetical protein
VTLRSPATLAVMTSPAPALGPWSGRPPSPPGWRRENMATGRAHTAQQNVVIAAMRRPTLGSSMKEAGLRAVRFEKRRNWRRFLGHVGLEASKLRGGWRQKSLSAPFGEHLLPDDLSFTACCPVATPPLNPPGEGLSGSSPARKVSG